MSHRRPIRSGAADKLDEVICSMAVSGAPLKERLLGAFHGLIFLKEEEFPEGEARDLWLDVLARATAISPQGFDPREGSLRATLYRMRRPELERIAKDLVSIRDILIG